ncbi:hypothetical protein SMICM17S_00185 [Streptomyces microflavus]
MLLVHARQEARHVDQRDQGDVEVSQNCTNCAAFSEALMSSTPAEEMGWFATIPTTSPPIRDRAQTMLVAQAGCTSK